MTQLNALVMYFSPGGNTKKVAEAIAQGLESQQAKVTLGSLNELQEADLYDYDLVCLGAPAYNFTVPDPVKRYSSQQMKIHNASGNVVPGAPQRPGLWGVTFVTYAGPHTGIAEATPAGDHMAQMLRHLGYQVRCQWYTLGAYHGDRDQPNNTIGYLGDIRGRPDEHDLAVAQRNAAGLAYGLMREKAKQES